MLLRSNSCEQNAELADVLLSLSYISESDAFKLAVPRNSTLFRLSQRSSHSLIFEPDVYNTYIFCKDLIKHNKQDYLDKGL